VSIVAFTLVADAFINGGTQLMLGMVYSRVAIVFGFFVAMIVGIGVCLYDVGPQLNTFWRTRPINPDVWFWCKYSTGLAIVLAAIYAPILMLAALGDDSINVGTNHPEALAIVIGQIAIFAAAVAMTCLVRHAVYAAILSIAALYIGALLGGLMWMVAGLLGWVQLNRIWWNPTEMAIIVGLLSSIAVSTIVAWLAVRYDWGWKSR
jgi:hypothetical protein